MDSYQILGVDYDADQRVIKRAYSTLIKQYRPDSHPQEFARIRSAYETLMEQCRYQAQYEDSGWAETQILASAETTEQEPAPELPSEDRQTEDNDDSFNRLVDKPVIQLSVHNLQTEEHGDRYSRLVDKPIILQEDTEPAPSSEELAWLAKPAIDVAALIEQLTTYQQPANEQAALVCFQSQLSVFASMNLDQRMDYEEILHASLLLNDRPALLVFAAARDYFAWTRQTQTSLIDASQSQWSQRFDTLTQLSTLYRRICQRYNPYFQAQHDAPVKPCRLTTHYHHLIAQNQRDEWLQQAKTGEVADLQAYFTDKPAHRPLYIIDIVLGTGLSYWALIEVLSDADFNYPFLTEYFQAVTWLMSAGAIAGGFLLAWLLSGLPVVKLFLQTLMLKFSSGLRRTIFSVVIGIITLVVFAQDHTDDVRQLLSGIFGLIFLQILIYYLLIFLCRCFYSLLLRWYAYLIKLETMTVRILESIARLPFLHKKTNRPTNN